MAPPLDTQPALPAPDAKRSDGPDPWAWLRDRDDPDVLAYLRASNEHTEAVLAPLRGMRDEVFADIRARTQETDLTVPVQKGPWRYFTRTVEGLDYGIHCREPLDGRGEQVLLDENDEAGEGDFFALGAFDVSPQHSLLAWSADRDGSEVFELRFRDLVTGTDRPDRVARTYDAGTAWSSDEQHCFYVVADEQWRPYQVWRHVLGTDPAGDVLVLEEPDERFFVGVELTRSERWVVITSHSRTTSAVWAVPASEPTRSPVEVVPRVADRECSVEHRGDRFLLLTNDGAEDFRLVSAPETDPSQWTEVVPHEPGRRIAAVDAFRDFVVLHEWAGGLPRLRVLFDDGSDRVLAFDEPVHAVEPGLNPSFDAATYRFEYESYVTPPSVYDEVVATGERTLLKTTPVLGGVDLGQYEAVREWAEAPDGERVPVDVVRHRSTPLDGTAPLVLYGYGAYETSLGPWFSIPRLSLLDRGVLFAVAHPRGGGELGRRWYREGKLLQKRTSFTDFLACADHLAGNGWCDPRRMAARGGSAGGLLVGAAVAMRPDRFAAVLAEVPFVDVVTSMLDPSLPLTVTEWEEWGDPRDPEQRAYLASYSPYDNVAAVPYPAMLVTAGLNDPRVSYHEPAKWVAKIRAVTTGDRPVLLWTELGAGHAGPSGRYDAWREEARNLAFLVDALAPST
jgi:oligopeptidase B